MINLGIRFVNTAMKEIFQIYSGSSHKKFSNQKKQFKYWKKLLRESELFKMPVFSIQISNRIIFCLKLQKKINYNANCPLLQLEQIFGTYKSFHVGHKNFYINNLVNQLMFGIQGFFFISCQTGKFPLVNLSIMTDEKKINQLKKIENFSYKNAVEKSNKKRKENCTPQMEDLFKRIFVIDAKKRITVAEIQEHPVFNKEKQKEIKLKIENFFMYQQINKRKNLSYLEQKEYLHIKHEKICFLLAAERQVQEICEVMDEEEILPLRYSLLRNYIILMKQFIHNLQTKVIQKQVNLNWQGFIQSQEFKTILKDFKTKAGQAQQRLKILYNNSICKMKQRKNFNSTVEQRLSLFIQEGEKFQNIKYSYRHSTNNFYSKLRKITEKNSKYLYFLVMITMCHCFNKIVQESDKNLKEFFVPFFKNEILHNETIIDFAELRYCFKKASETQQTNIINSLLARYFA